MRGVKLVLHFCNMTSNLALGQQKMDGGLILHMGYCYSLNFKCIIIIL